MVAKYGLILGFFLLSLIISSILIRKGIPRLKKKAAPGDKQEKQEHPPLLRDIGFWIGFFEHVIIFVFVMNKEFSALAIIFGAKEFVRKEDIKANPAYYLLGTLINFGIALTMVEIMKEVLRMTCMG